MSIEPAKTADEQRSQVQRRATGRRPVDIMFIGLRSIGGGQGGVEKHVASLVEEYERRGIRTCVVVRSPYAAEDPPHVGNSTWTKSIWSPRKSSIEAIVHSLLATFYAGAVRPKVLHIHAVGPSLVAPLARLLGLRVVSTHHGQDYDREKWGTFAKFSLRVGERFQASFSNGRICVSSSLSEQLTDRYNTDFVYIPNAVRAPVSPVNFDALGQFGITAGKYIVNVSRLVPEKRQLDLIAAYKLLDRPDLKLVLVGGADHVSDYSEELHRVARATPGVVLTGFQQGDTLVQLIGGAAVFALPSSHEGMPIAALEAMSMHRPVVLSDIAPNLDLGLPDSAYHKVGSVESLAERLTETLASHAHEPIASQDWSAVLQFYDWSTVADQTLQVYSQASTKFARLAGGPSSL